MLAIAQALADQALAIDEETQPEDHLNQASRSPRPPEVCSLRFLLEEHATFLNKTY